MKGHITKIVNSKNYGFIKDNESNSEIFFHKSDLEGGIVFGALKKGDIVRFFVEETDKGKKATCIIKA